MRRCNDAAEMGAEVGIRGEEGEEGEKADEGNQKREREREGGKEGEIQRPNADSSRKLTWRKKDLDLSGWWPCFFHIC